jgi:uncharacterized membrane protein YozB (DUF420 family)
METNSVRGILTVGLLGAQVPSVVALMFIGEAAMLAVFIVAWLLGRLHKGKYHHYVMLAAFATDMLVFKPLMTTRALEVFGPFPWPGTSISLHLYLDLAVTVLGFVSIYYGFKFRIKKGGKMFLPPKGRMHKWAGYLFIAFWIATFVLGIRIFAWAHLG